MTPIDYVHIDSDIFIRQDLSSTEKIILGLVKSFSSQGLALSNDEIGKIVSTRGDTVSKILSELQAKNLIHINNHQSKYRRIYFGKNSKVKDISLRDKVQSSPPLLRDKVQSKTVLLRDLSQDTLEKTPNITKGTNKEEEVFAYWNSTPKLPKARKLSTQRRNHLKARLSEPEFSQHWQEIITTIANTPFLCGDNQRGWKADFDWFIKNDTNYLKVLEGKYAASSKPAPTEEEFVPGALDRNGLAICGEPSEEYARKLLGSLQQW